MDSDKPLVGIVMGSDSDWPLVKKACDTNHASSAPTVRLKWRLNIPEAQKGAD